MLLDEVTHGKSRPWMTEEEFLTGLALAQVRTPDLMVVRGLPSFEYLLILNKSIDFNFMNRQCQARSSTLPRILEP